MIGGATRALTSAGLRFLILCACRHGTSRLRKKSLKTCLQPILIVSGRAIDRRYWVCLRACARAWRASDANSRVLYKIYINFNFMHKIVLLHIKMLICCSLEPFSIPQYKKLGPGPAKVLKRPKKSQKTYRLEKWPRYCYKFMKFGFKTAYILFSR